MAPGSGNNEHTPACKSDWLQPGVPHCRNLPNELPPSFAATAAAGNVNADSEVDCSRHVDAGAVGRAATTDAAAVVAVAAGNVTELGGTAGLAASSTSAAVPASWHMVGSVTASDCSFRMVFVDDCMAPRPLKVL